MLGVSWASTPPLRSRFAALLSVLHGRQHFVLRSRSALRLPDPFAKYFYGRKACTLLGKATVSNFTVSLSLSSSEKHRPWPVCRLLLVHRLPCPPANTPTPSGLRPVARLQLLHPLCWHRFCHPRPHARPRLPFGSPFGLTHPSQGSRCPHPSRGSSSRSHPSNGRT